MITRITSTGFAVAALILALASCGGGGLGDTPNPVTLPLLSNAGYQRSVNATTGATATLMSGDNANFSPAGPIRSLLTFSLSALPDGATVTHAELRLRQAAVVGSASKFTWLYVDHVDYGPNLPTNAHFAGGTLVGGWEVAMLQANNEMGVRAFDVTQSVQDDVGMHRGRSQFRIRYDPENSSSPFPDIMHFEDALNTQGTGEVPVLLVSFTP